MLMNMVIRPPRNQYPDDTASNGSTFKIGAKTFKKSIFKLKNKQDLNLCCTFIEPVDTERTSDKMPCVIYMHGNAGNK